MNRLLLGVAGAIVLALALPALSGAATNYDLSYQNGGSLLLPQVRGVYGQVAQSCEVTGKNLSLAGRFGRNSPGLPTTWSKTQRLGVASVKLTPRQPMDLGVAKVRWRMQRIPTGHAVTSEDFADDGSFAYLTQPTKRGAGEQAKLFRVDADGKRIKSFGRNGYVSITLDTSKSRGSVRVIALPAGKVMVIGAEGKTQMILRFTKRGRLDATWGNDGVVELAATDLKLPYTLGPADAASVTAAGGLLIGAYGAPGKPAAKSIGILKLTAAGRIDTAWADRGFWTPPTTAANASNGQPYDGPADAMLTTVLKDGSFAVLYGASAKEGDLAFITDLKLAYVDKTSGITTLFNERAGSYLTGGDGGFPDANPWVLASSSAGPILAHAFSRYGSPGGTFGGQATRFSLDANQPAASAKIDNTGFATGDFAVDPAAKFLYACGAFGVTSSKAKTPAAREQRKSVAIKRIKL